MGIKEGDDMQQRSMAKLEPLQVYIILISQLHQQNNPIF